jgi:hypothetical protein
VLRETQMTHVIRGDEPFLERTLASVGIPALHVVRAYNAAEYRFYELTGDLQTALHFSDFTEPSPTHKERIRQRIHLSGTISLEEAPANPAHGKVTLRD